MTPQRIYTAISYGLTPAFRILSHIRIRGDKEIKSRIGERFGMTDIVRPQGKLVWIHAASNGEALSALPFIHGLKNLPAAPSVLVTTMTATAAKLMQKRLPKEGCIHQFIPYDHPSWIDDFHRHWQPDLAVWVESEIWPNHLSYLKKKDIPAILVNARLSEKSVARWAYARQWFQSLLSAFDLCLAQTGRDKANLESLGISNVRCEGNLKNIALPLPYDEYALEDMSLCTGKRPMLLFASTHDGEEAIAARIHENLQSSCPGLLTIIIPRHPKRGEAIAAALAAPLSATGRQLNIARRSLKMSPRRDTDIYIADTLGELGLFYRLCDIVFVGNSMNTKPGGGHNLLEPALLKCAIITGDDLHNFSEQATEMPQRKACVIVRSEDELLAACRATLDNAEKRTSLIGNALAYAEEKQAAGMEKIFSACESVFKKAQLL